MVFDKLKTLSISYLDDMRNSGMTLEEAKSTLNFMTAILDDSQRYEPETLLNELSFKINQMPGIGR
jgi:hypothetical protein